MVAQEVPATRIERLLDPIRRFRSYLNENPTTTQFGIHNASPAYHIGDVADLVRDQVPKSVILINKKPGEIEELLRGDHTLTLSLSERLHSLLTGVSQDLSLLRFTDLSGDHHFYRLKKGRETVELLLETSRLEISRMFPRPPEGMSQAPTFEFRKMRPRDLAELLSVSQKKLSITLKDQPDQALVEGNLFLLGFLFKNLSLTLRDLEVLNLFSAFEAIPADQAKDPYVRQMLGVLRGTQQIFSVDGNTVEVDVRFTQMGSPKFAFMPAREVPVSMERWLMDFNGISEGASLPEIARLVKRYIAIHPFVDGNGRTARMLLDFMLLKSGRPPLELDRKLWIEVTFLDQEGLAQRFAELYRRNTNAISSGVGAKIEVKVPQRPASEFKTDHLDPFKFVGDKRRLGMALRAVHEVTQLGRNLLPPLFLSSYPRGNSAHARTGQLHTRDFSSRAWAKMSDEELIQGSRHEAGHLIFGRNMDSLSPRWKSLQTKVDDLRERRHQESTEKAGDPAIRKIDDVLGGYDELMADFTAALLAKHPSLSIENMVRANKIDMGDTSSEWFPWNTLRRFDATVDRENEKVWLDLLTSKHARYVYFSKVRRLLWDKVSEALSRGVPDHIIYETIVHLMARHFDSLGHALERGELDPKEANRTLAELIAQTSF